VQLADALLKRATKILYAGARDGAAGLLGDGQPPLEKWLATELVY